jgi:predicted nuclease of restriction endonuclease-like (RecB) superfamily
MTDLPVPDDYARWLSNLKSHIQGARARAVLAVNQELVRLYHRIGTEILERQERQGWGARVIERLSSDLREAFPDMKGFSSRNLKYMKAFAQTCPDLQLGQQPAAQLPWFHIVILLTKIPELDDYAKLLGRAAPRTGARRGRSTALAPRVGAF